MSMQNLEPKEFLDEIYQQLNNNKFLFNLYNQTKLEIDKSDDEGTIYLQKFENQILEGMKHIREGMIKYLRSRSRQIVKTALDCYSDEQLRLTCDDFVLQNELYEICGLAQEILNERAQSV